MTDLLLYTIGGLIFGGPGIALMALVAPGKPTQSDRQGGDHGDR